MSATPITWAEWYRTAGITAATAHRAQIERAHPSAALGPDDWKSTSATRLTVRSASRLTARDTAPRCGVCGRPIREGASIGIRNARPLHLHPCLDAYDAAHATPATTTDEENR